MAPTGGSFVVAGKVVIDGGSFNHNMAGVSRTFSGGGGLIVATLGAMLFEKGAPTNIPTLNTNMRISGGTVKLSGQVYIGFNVPTTFEVVGSKAKIEVFRLNAGPGNSPRTVHFVLDSIGVSKINVPGWMNLGKSRLVVDGSAYTQGPESIALIDSKKTH